MPFPTLRHPPITEALLDIRVEREQPITVDDLNPFQATVVGAYPKATETTQVEANVSMGPSPSASLASDEPRFLGRTFWNEEGTRAVQGRVDGFSVNHVRSYENWDALQADARTFWPIYVEATEPDRVVRCGLRFINRIELPAEVDLSESLQTRPVVATALPQFLENYFMHVVIPFENDRKAGIVQLTQVDPTIEGRMLIVDIDVFVERSFSPSGEELWEELEALRDVKNRCFFNTLQQKKWEEYL